LEKFVINGGRKLQGTVHISGAKNAAVAILPATLLVEGISVIENVPDISDVATLINLISKLGAKVEKLNRNTLKIDTTKITTYKAPYDIAHKLRGSYYLLGSLLGRMNRAEVAMPGGCNFGQRPIDQHFEGFEALGAKVVTEYGIIKARADELKAAHVYLDVVSVGATINVMLAAVKAKGTTVIENAAKEPHIVDVANFLNAMGANIKGAGTDVIRVKGVEKLPGNASYSIIPDQIEAGTYMIAAAASGGDVTVADIIPRHMDSLSAKLLEMNVGVEEGESTIRVFSKGPIQKADVKTQPYPGFPTDLQPQITTLLCMAEGISTVSERVWDNRFQYVDELKRLGANIRVEGKTAIIEGPCTLTGAPVKSNDLRAGAALVIAGLLAKGTTEVYKVDLIDRGYEDFAEKLSKLGADIKRVKADNDDRWING